MKAAALIERLDDKLNPIVVKELRQAFQGRWVVGALLSFLTLQVVILGMFLMMAQPVEDGNFAMNAGRDVFRVMQGILLTTCMLLVPAYAGMRLAAERNDANVDLLFISTLTPRGIIWGKFSAAVVLTLLIFSACAPFMTFTYLLRGIDLLTIGLVLLIDFAAVIGATMLAIFTATIPGNRALRGIVGLGAFIAMCYIYGLTLAGTIAMTQWGLPVDQEEFWWAIATFAMLLIMTLALLYTASVSLVSPPSANRALPMRLGLLATWLITGAAAITWTISMQDMIPVYIWMICAIILFGAYLFVAINEREYWTPRVARTIPRNLPGRVGAFLLYSGAGGGVLFSIVIWALTVAVTFIVEEFDPTFMRHISSRENPTITMMTMATYALAYALTATLLRRHLLGRWIRPEFTWVLVLLLIGLGSTVPFLFQFLFLPRSFNYGYGYDQFNIWMAPNPFWILDDWRNRESYLAFASVWCAAVLALSVPWLYGQLERFRRFEVGELPVEAVIPVPEVMNVLPVGEAEAEAIKVTSAEPM